MVDYFRAVDLQRGVYRFEPTLSQSLFREREQVIRAQLLNVIDAQSHGFCRGFGFIPPPNESVPVMTYVSLKMHKIHPKSMEPQTSPPKKNLATSLLRRMVMWQSNSCQIRQSRSCQIGIAITQIGITSCQITIRLAILPNMKQMFSTAVLGGGSWEEIRPWPPHPVWL